MVPPTEPNGPCALTLRLLPSRLPDRAFCPALVSTLRAVDVVRILSPDLGEPFVSLSRIFLLCDIPPSLGLQHFSLSLPLTYDVSLANLAPFDDIWVSLRVARCVARELGVEGELDPLLEWGGRRAWTDARFDDSGRCVLTQNWYASLCPRPFAPFYKIEVRDSRHTTVLDPFELQQLRSPALNTRPSPSSREEAFLRAWEKVTIWSAFAYEEYRDSQVASKPTRPTTVTFEEPASVSLQEAFPSLLYESTYALEDLLTSLTTLSPSPYSQGPGHPLTAGRHGPVPQHTTLHSLFTLTTSHALVLLHLRALSAALDAPAREGMRTWLQGVPANPSPVPGLTPIGSPSPGDPQKSGQQEQLTPPRSPKGKENGIEAHQQRDAHTPAVVEVGLEERFKELEGRYQATLFRLSELEASEERVKELEARLAEIGVPAPTDKEEPTLEDEAEQEQEQEASLTVDEEDEEAVLARLEARRDDALNLGSQRDSPIAPAANEEKRRLNGRSRSRSSDSDSSTIRPSSPLPGLSAEREEHDLLAQAGAGVKPIVRVMEGRRRFRWWAWIRFCSAVVVLLLAIWLGLEGAQRVGWEIQLDDVREYASMGWAVVYQCGTSGVDLLVQGARGGMEMLKQVAP